MPRRCRRRSAPAGLTLAGGIAHADTVYYRIVAKHSGKCLDVAWLEQKDGAAVVQSKCWNGKNQRWTFATIGQ